ncbi:hypothetical protein [Nocardioides sp.]|uniref:hypothetical protein n=1 Tax=Nocardioides sp. TaxID=35761 RepID=UPI0039E6572A
MRRVERAGEQRYGSSSARRSPALFRARARVVLGVALCLALLAACTPDRAEVSWHEVTLPAPGAEGRVTVRDATRCGEEWLAVGGVWLAHPTADQDSTPAAWRSADGRDWQPVAIHADTYWGQRALLTSVACSDGRVTVIGARAGGAHGIPRVTPFYLQGGALEDVAVGYTLFGGENATNVGPMTGGPQWLIAGNRSSGPAFWTSTGQGEFTLHEGVPGLANDAGFSALAQAATWTGNGWLLVGAGSVPGVLDRVPLAWTSPDGETWQREEAPGSDGFDDLQRVIATADGALALGLLGDTFGAWRRTEDGWSTPTPFGRLPSTASKSPYVASLTSDGDEFWATTSDGASYSLWRSADGEDWQRVTPPAPPPEAGGEQLLAAAAAAGRVLLFSDDGESSRLWWTD